MPRSPGPPPPPNPERPGTLIESPEDICRAMQARKAAQPPAPAPAPQPTPSPPVPAARPYRPTFRPPVALLTVFDDGEKDGEVVRLRADRFVIGRTEGDFLIPHDGLISARHVEITRQRIGEGYRWVVTDLQTTNGLFVRVSRTVLADQSEFLVGRGRYRFELPGTELPGGDDPQTSDPPSEYTRPWGSDYALPRTLVLIEMQAGEAVARVPLVAAEYWIGSDLACAICRAGDPFVEPRHARLHRDASGAWHAHHNKSLNGLWLKVPQITVEEGCLFQIGEQRCRLTVGG
jgi:hypothetical protein